MLDEIALRRNDGRNALIGSDVRLSVRIDVASHSGNAIDEIANIRSEHGLVMCDSVADTSNEIQLGV